MSFISKVVGLMLLSDLICACTLLYLLRRSGLGWAWRAALAAFFVVQITGLLLLIGSRTSGSEVDFLLTQPHLAAVYIWHCLIALPLAGVSLLAWTVVAVRSAIVAGIRRRGRSREHAPAVGTAGGMSRRQFLTGVTALAPPVLCLGATAWSMPQLEQFRVRRFTLRLAGLPPELDGLTIAHLSDLHVGRFTNGAVLEQFIAATNAMKANLVLLTGDLINYALSDLPAAIRLVQRLRAVDGVYLCEGNHDLIEDGDAFVARVKASGLNLLVNETASVLIRGREVQLLGLRWGSPTPSAIRAAQYGDRAVAASVGQLLALRKTEAFPILLAHHPHAFDYATGVPLTLAGHTHGGQLMATNDLGFGPMLFRYWSGRYDNDGRTLLVSNGVGNWFPLRTRAPAEIIHVTLRHSSA